MLKNINQTTATSLIDHNLFFQSKVTYGIKSLPLAQLPLNLITRIIQIDYMPPGFFCRVCMSICDFSSVFFFYQTPQFRVCGKKTTTDNVKKNCNIVLKG